MVNDERDDELYALLPHVVRCVKARAEFQDAREKVAGSMLLNAIELFRGIVFGGGSVMVNDETHEELDKIMIAVDEQCIQRGEPILSIMARLDDGSIGGATRYILEKYKLRREGESDKELINRLEVEAHDFYIKK